MKIDQTMWMRRLGCTFAMYTAVGLFSAPKDRPVLIFKCTRTKNNLLQIKQVYFHLISSSNLADNNPSTSSPPCLCDIKMSANVAHLLEFCLLPWT